MTAYAPPATIAWYPEGETATTATVGDLVLVRHSGMVVGLIRFGQKLRRAGPYGWCNHAATVVGVSDGLVSIAEATAKGVVVTPLVGYTHELYAIVSPRVSTQERTNAAAYAAGTEGDAYGWVTIAGEVVYVLTGLPIVFGFGRSVICSGDAATAQICSRLRPDKAVIMTMPADLAKWFNVSPSSGVVL